MRLLESFAIIEVQPLQHGVELERPRRREAKQLAPFVARPNLVSRQVPDPDAQIGGIDGQAHARLAFAQPGLAGLKLVDESRRP